MIAARCNLAVHSKDSCSASSSPRQCSSISLTLSSHSTYSDRAHRVLASRGVARPLAQPRGGKAAGAADEFVFPGERSPSHIASRSVSKAMERTRDKLGIKDITMHDLRRTAGTYISQYGVPKDVRERILNHGGMRKGSITESVYNRYEYDAEKRAALELWADALAGIIAGRPTEIRGYHARLARLKGSDRIKVA